MLDARFRDVLHLGGGTFGRVVGGCAIDAIHGEANKSVAVKLYRRMQDDMGVCSTIVREVFVLRRLSHPHVVRVLDIMSAAQDKVVSLVLERGSGTLLSAVRDKAWRSESMEALHAQLVAGVGHLHRRGVMHRDLKPENCVLSDGGALKIVDFGSACMLSPGRCYSLDCATRWYRAPEMMLGRGLYDERVDDWSVGCIRAFMIERKPPFSDDTEWGVWKEHMRRLGTPDEETYRRLGASWPDLIPYETTPKLRVVDLVGDDETRRWLSIDVANRKRAIDLQRDDRGALGVEPAPEAAAAWRELVFVPDAPKAETAPLALHAELTMCTRRKVVEWILVIAAAYSFCVDTLVTTLCLFHERLERTPAIPVKRIQLTCLAAINVASKLWGDGFLLSDLHRMSRCVYSEDEISAAEHDMVSHASAPPRSPREYLRFFVAARPGPSSWPPDRKRFAAAIVSAIALDGRRPRDEGDAREVLRVWEGHTTLLQGVEAGAEAALWLRQAASASEGWRRLFGAMLG